MIHPTVEKKLIKETLTKAKTVAMVGVSFNKKEETRTSIRRRPSIIVMKYLQEFGYRVVPVNPSSAGKKNMWRNRCCSIRRYFNSHRYS